MKIPIVLTAFGTTTKAFKNYALIEKILRKNFPGHEIHWAYSSRIVRERMAKRSTAELKHPHQVLENLRAKGHQWAVVQSMHLICGHEFYRLVEEVKQSPIRTSIGLPLLSSTEDYEAVVKGLGSRFHDPENHAVVLIGHGTDHPIWSSYMALNHMFCERFGPNIYVGVIEGHPSRDKIVNDVTMSGLKRVHLIPFMLVAGTHFKEDLAGDDDSWKTAFEQKQISVSIKPEGIGSIPEIHHIFCRHIREACAVIP